MDCLERVEDGCGFDEDPTSLSGGVELPSGVLDTTTDDPETLVDCNDADVTPFWVALEAVSTVPGVVESGLYELCAEAVVEVAPEDVIAIELVVLSDVLPVIDAAGEGSTEVDPEFEGRVTGEDTDELLSNSDDDNFVEETSEDELVGVKLVAAMDEEDGVKLLAEDQSV